MRLEQPAMCADVVEISSPSAVVRVTSPVRLPIERRKLLLSPSATEIEVSGYQRLGRAQREISSLTEDIDHMRTELKSLSFQRDFKVPRLQGGMTNVSISTVDTSRLDSTFSGITYKVDAMKLDLDTERRQRLAREEDARSRLQHVQQTSDAHAAHQFHTDARVRKLEDALTAMESRMDLFYQDLDQSLKKRKEGEDALWLALQEVRDGLSKEAGLRTSKDEELSQVAAGLQQQLEQERGERRAAAEQLAAERRADLSRVVSLEAQVAQAADALESKFRALRDLLDGEKAARNEAVAKLERDLAAVSLASRNDKDAAERRLNAFKDHCDKDLEEKLRSHRHSLETSLDRKLAELKDSMEQGFTLAKQGRDSIQFALERERESRKAQGETQLASFEARLEPLLARLSQVERQSEAVSSKAERTLQEHQRLQTLVEERLDSDRRDLHSWRVELDVLKKKAAEAEHSHSEAKRLKELLDRLPCDVGDLLKKLEGRCGSLEKELRQELSSAQHEARERAARQDEACKRLEERLHLEEDFTAKLKKAAR